jgi:hypothetical protein
VDSLIEKGSAMRGIIIAALLLVAGPVLAQQALKSEPLPGHLGSGQTVLVDDGTCGPGKIKQITGGSDKDRLGGGQSGKQRSRKCISR